VFDLRRARQRKEAFDALKDRGPVTRLDLAFDRGERVVIGYLRYGFVGVCAVVALVAAVVRPEPGVAVAAAALAAVAQVMLAVAVLGVTSLGVVFWSVLRAVLVRARALPPPTERPHVLPLPPPIERDAEGQVRVRGVVRVSAPLTSPVGGAPCAAFRVVGEAPGGRVDDAGLTSFEVVGDAGEHVVVRGGVGTVVLDVDAHARVVRPDGQLARFLEERGAFPALGPVRLAEAVLAPGDRVVVEGRAEETLHADGYRDMRATLVLRDAPDAPLVIRRG
jgi:hypothetical protein